MSNEVIPAGQKHMELKRVLRDLLEKGKHEFAMVLPQHMSPERMIRIAITACTMQPKLLNCTKESIALSLLTASQTGLEPDGYHGHLVPYGNVCQFIPDYKGLIQLALDNGVVIDGYAVRKKDQFAYELGTQPFIKHVPSDESDRGPLRCAYAVAHFRGRPAKFVVATRADVEKRRQASKATSADSPWAKWEEEMWIKSAVKMLMKYVPRSPAMKAALIADDTAERGLPQNPNYVLQPPTHIESTVEHALDEMTPTFDETPKAESKTEKAAKAMKKKKEEEPVAPLLPAEETPVEPTPAIGLPADFAAALAAAKTEHEARQVWSEHIFEYKDVIGPEVYVLGCRLRDAKIKELGQQ